TPSESSTANLAHHSASPSLSNKRPFSAGAAPQDGDADATISGAAALKDHLRESLGAASRGRRQTVPAQRGRSENTLGRRITRAAADSGPGNANPGGSDTFRPASAESGDDMGNSGAGPSRWDPRKVRSNNNPASYDSRFAAHASPKQDKLRPKRPRESTGSLNNGQKPAGGVSAVAGGTESHGIFLQPETHPITEEQLINEVRGIYAGLVMVEKKCIEIDKQQSESKSDLSSMQWQALIALHRTLLHEHHDFFLASQHPSASPVLRRLSEKYSMPARMWRYGIHSFLELLRHRLPDSLEHMLTFIYLAYSMMTLLLESVPAFEETWIECLGDLARYRMAVEEADLRDREVWAGVARYWYNKAADKNPDVGRIQHHLAVLARPDMVQQLFYYTKSLVSVHSFPSAGESILLLFNPFLNGVKTYHQHPVVTKFVGAHGHLFTRGPTDQFFALAKEYISHLEKYIGRVGAAFRSQGVYMASCNFAAMFQYGRTDSLMSAEFKQNTVQQRSQLIEGVYSYASENWTSVDDPETVKVDFLALRSSQSTSQLIFYGACLTGRTFSAMLDEVGDKNVYPSLHSGLAFIWCLALNRTSIRFIEAVMPWRKIANFLKTMIRDDTDTRIMESEDFPIVEEGKQMPEDFLIRGQRWSQNYYPANFFDDSPSEDEGRSIEVPSLNVSRAYRCLWLGARIAKFNRWFTYESASKRFSTTPFASVLEEFSEQHNPFYTKEVEMQDPANTDVEMQNV
ncbi:hypothetical protein ASPWEDRAFT_100095, partial [Aspergillus wentii DTO 134E9]